MKQTPKIALIGCGKMGESLLRGWLKAKIKASFVVVEPHGIPKSIKGVKALKKSDAALRDCNIIVLAVKPQAMTEVCAGLAPFIDKKSLIISIAAGRSIKSFEKAFGKQQPVIRTMPNLPASIGKGMTVAVASKNVSAAQKKSATKLMECVGHVEWLANENLIDAATAVMGNGPAYLFYLIELMAEAGRKAGLKADLAMTLARQTVIGASALAEATPETDAATLRKNVTSPGGTTEAALKVLMNGEIQKIFDQAIAAGKKRSKELSA